MQSLAIKVEVPIACFRTSLSREYIETYPVPPPSTVYGMLLSCIGEMDRYKHLGTKLAIAMLTKPQESTILRTFRRYKSKTFTDAVNAKPDFMTILSDIEFVVWVDSNDDNADIKLADRLRNAFARPETINRFGNVCLGESRDMVNSLDILDPAIEIDGIYEWLIKNEEDGELTLPYWVDHISGDGTKFGRYSLKPLEEVNMKTPPSLAWTEIKEN